jgi:alpha-L-fucosidase 2
LSPGNGRYFDEVTGSYIPGTTVCAGSSIDMQIIYDLFTNYNEAATLLNFDAEMVKRVAEARSKLVPPQIGKDGSLQEWTDDWEQLEKNHRHFSHLYGLYPGNVLSIRKTPHLIDACKKVLEQRGDGGAGWSRAWKVALWARLKDGSRAEKVYKEYLRDQAYPQLFAKCFTPLQVDGTLGMTAGITEMLVQSNEDYIEPLPALPQAWTNGKIGGVCVRGGFVINMSWKNGKVNELTFYSKAGSVCKLILNQTRVKIVSNGKAVHFRRANNLITFGTAKNNSYSIILSN